MKESRTGIKASIAQDFINSAKNATTTGQGQFFTPESFAKLISKPLNKTQSHVVDLCMGDGTLLNSVNAEFKYGIDIDGFHFPPESSSFYTADLTEWYDLAYRVKFESDLYTLNPPFSLEWYVKRLKNLSHSSCLPVRQVFNKYADKDVIDSTLATLLIALDRLSEFGEGYMICNNDTAQRFFGEQGLHPELGKSIWLWLTVEGEVFRDINYPFDTAVLYFSRSHMRADKNSHILTTSTENLENTLDTASQLRNSLQCGSKRYSEYNIPCIKEKWSIIQQELEIIKSDLKPEYNISLSKTGKIQTYLTSFQESDRTLPKKELDVLNSLSGRIPMQMVVQHSERIALLSAVHNPLWRVEENLIKQVKISIREYESVRAPFRKPCVVQALGWLDESSTITAKTDTLKGIEKGKSYKLTTQIEDTEWLGKRHNLAGEREDLSFNGKELCVSVHTGLRLDEENLKSSSDLIHHFHIRRDKKKHQHENHHAIDTLLENFVINTPEDITEQKPEIYKDMTSKIHDIQKSVDLRFRKQGEKFAYMQYQIEDLTRAAMHDGAILAWDPGLGKTLAIFTYPMLKGSKRCLIVAPTELHKQIIDTGNKFFGAKIKELYNQADYYKNQLWLPADENNSSIEYFITDYRKLGYNGADEWEETKVNNTIRQRRYNLISKLYKIDYVHADTIIQKGSVTSDTAASFLNCPPDADRNTFKKAYRKLAKLHHPDLHPDDPEAERKMKLLNTAIEFALKGNAQHIINSVSSEVEEQAVKVSMFESGIGHTKKMTNDHKVKCVFSPSLSSLISHSFDTLVGDEAVRVKNAKSYQSQGILNMCPSYRLLMSGTPIKNRLPDIFWLAWWVAGGKELAHARFPYNGTIEAQTDFSNSHLQLEVNLTKKQKSEADPEASGSFKKRSNKICNVHRLWKTLGPVLVRRRKDDIGKELAKKNIIPINIQPGTNQQDVYQYFTDHVPDAKTPIAAMGMRLQNLRQAALSPFSSKLKHNLETSIWTPKIAAILQLAADLMEKGEQLIVFSPFQDFSDALHNVFQSNGVDCITLDGKTTPKMRGKLADNFKNKKHPVLIAGIKSMGEGHSFEQCRNLVLPSLDWAYDGNGQAIERVHRLTSKLTVNIYIMVTSNTIDERLAQIFQEKGDSSDLALDARLFEDEREEVSLSDLLKDAVDDFDPNAKTISEAEIFENAKSSILPRLQKLGSYWNQQKENASKPEQPQTPDPVQIETRPISSINRIETKATRSNLITSHREPTKPTPKSESVMPPEAVNLLNMFATVKPEKVEPEATQEESTEAEQKTRIYDFTKGMFGHIQQ